MGTVSEDFPEAEQSIMIWEISILHFLYEKKIMMCQNNWMSS